MERRGRRATVRPAAGLLSSPITLIQTVIYEDGAEAVLQDSRELAEGSVIAVALQGVNTPERTQRW